MTVALHPLAFRLACAALALAFAFSGVAKLIDFPAAIAEAAHFGLQPAVLFAIATIATQLAGALLTVFASGRWQALGAIALAGFTVLSTVIGHAFWSMDGIERFHNRNSFIEHIGLVGGLLLMAHLAWPRRADSR